MMLCTFANTNRDCVIVIICSSLDDRQQRGDNRMRANCRIQFKRLFISNDTCLFFILHNHDLPIYNSTNSNQIQMAHVRYILFTLMSARTREFKSVGVQVGGHRKTCSNSMNGDFLFHRIICRFKNQKKDAIFLCYSCEI